MKLIFITEAIQGLQTASDKLGLPLEQLDKLLTDADPTGRKYKSFILKLLLKQAIRLPEDNHRVKETLTNFQKYQNNLEVKDILRYNSLHDLETALEPCLGGVSKRQGGNNLNPLSLPGVELILDRGEYKTYKVTDVESLMDIGEGTKWCTRRSYPNCQAERYIDQYRWIGVIYKGGMPFIQYTPDYSEVMDVNDEKVKFDISNIVPKPDINANYIEILDYIKNIKHKRWPEVEHIMLRNAYCAYMYARYAINDRWPEAESIISQDPQCAYYYARNIIEGCWPLAEPAIMKDAQWAYMYAKSIIDDRWLEAEPYIAKDKFYSFNYIERFPESEQTMIINKAK